MFYLAKHNTEYCASHTTLHIFILACLAQHSRTQHSTAPTHFLHHSGTTTARIRAHDTDGFPARTQLYIHKHTHIHTNLGYAVSNIYFSFSCFSALAAAVSRVAEHLATGIESNRTEPDYLHTLKSNETPRNARAMRFTKPNQTKPY